MGPREFGWSAPPLRVERAPAMGSRPVYAPATMRCMARHWRVCHYSSATVLPDVVAAVRVLGGHADASIGISGDPIRSDAAPRP